jgi:hypothetical protein
MAFQRQPRHKGAIFEHDSDMAACCKRTMKSQHSLRSGAPCTTPELEIGPGCAVHEQTRIWMVNFRLLFRPHRGLPGPGTRAATVTGAIHNHRHRRGTVFNAGGWVVGGWIRAAAPRGPRGRPNAYDIDNRCINEQHYCLEIGAGRRLETRFKETSLGARLPLLMSVEDKRDRPRDPIAVFGSGPKG